MKTSALKTCIPDLEYSHRTKSAIQWAFLVDLMANLKTARGNFGMNGQNVAVPVSSKALKYIINAKEWENNG